MEQSQLPLPSDVSLYGQSAVSQSIGLSIQSNRPFVVINPDPLPSSTPAIPTPEPATWLPMLIGCVVFLILQRMLLSCANPVDSGR